MKSLTKARPKEITTGLISDENNGEKTKPDIFIQISDFENVKRNLLNPIRALQKTESGLENSKYPVDKFSVMSQEAKLGDSLRKKVRTNTRKALSHSSLKRRNKFYIEKHGISAISGSLLDSCYDGQANNLLKNISKWNFNVFSLESATNGHSLFYIMRELFEVYGFCSQFNLDSLKLVMFVNMLEHGYHSSNPFHNSTHAADVLQAMHFNLREYKLVACMKKEENMAAILAAACHDVDHPGVNQTFLINTSNPLAALYNNISVLENHHYRVAITLLHKSKLLSHLPLHIWKTINSILMSVILATDITRQQQILASFKAHLDSGSFHLKENDSHRNFILQIALKCADICNPCRPWPICYRWSEMICEEFFRQGDCENKLGLPVLPPFDRKKSTVSSIQIGFIQFIIEPLFFDWDRFLCSRTSGMLLNILESNKLRWKTVIDRQQHINNNQTLSNNNILDLNSKKKLEIILREEEINRNLLNVDEYFNEINICNSNEEEVFLKNSDNYIKGASTQNQKTNSLLLKSLDSITNKAQIYNSSIEKDLNLESPPTVKNSIYYITSNNNNNNDSSTYNITPNDNIIILNGKRRLLTVSSINSKNTLPVLENIKSPINNKNIIVNNKFSNNSNIDTDRNFEINKTIDNNVNNNNNNDEINISKITELKANKIKIHSNSLDSDRRSSLPISNMSIEELDFWSHLSCSYKEKTNSSYNNKRRHSIATSENLESKDLSLHNNNCNITKNTAYNNPIIKNNSFNYSNNTSAVNDKFNAGFSLSPFSAFGSVGVYGKLASLPECSPTASKSDRTSPIEADIENNLFINDNFIHVSGELINNNNTIDNRGINNINVINANDGLKKKYLVETNKIENASDLLEKGFMRFSFEEDIGRKLSDFILEKNEEENNNTQILIKNKTNLYDEISTLASDVNKNINTFYNYIQVSTRRASFPLNISINPNVQRLKLIKELDKDVEQKYLEKKISINKIQEHENNELLQREKDVLLNENLLIYSKKINTGEQLVLDKDVNLVQSKISSKIDKKAIISNSLQAKLLLEKFIDQKQSENKNTSTKNEKSHKNNNKSEFPLTTIYAEQNKINHSVFLPSLCITITSRKRSSSLKPTYEEVLPLNSRGKGVLGYGSHDRMKHFLISLIDHCSKLYSQEEYRNRNKKDFIKNKFYISPFSVVS